MQPVQVQGNLTPRTLIQKVVTVVCNGRINNDESRDNSQDQPSATGTLIAELLLALYGDMVHARWLGAWFIGLAVVEFRYCVSALLKSYCKPSVLGSLVQSGTMVTIP